MSEPDLGVLGASCLAHLCISTSNPADDSLRRRALQLSSGFIDMRAYRNHENRLQFVHLMHKFFELIIFPSSTDYERDWRSTTGNLVTEMTDISHYGRYLKNPQAHAGFATTIDEIWPKLRFALNQRPNVKVVFLGTSRGGACAVMAALRMNHDDRLAAVVTFAQPRCVHKEVAAEVFDNIWGRRYFRFAGSKDPVPLLPKFNGYGHGRTLIHVMTDGTKDSRGRNATSRFGVMLDATKDVMSVRENPWRGHSIEWYIDNAAYVTNSEYPMTKTEAMDAFLNTFLSGLHGVPSAVDFQQMSSPMSSPHPMQMVGSISGHGMHMNGMASGLGVREQMMGGLGMHEQMMSSPGIMGGSRLRDQMMGSPGMMSGSGMLDQTMGSPGMMNSSGMRDQRMAGFDMRERMMGTSGVHEQMLGGSNMREQMMSGSGMREQMGGSSVAGEQMMGGVPRPMHRRYPGSTGSSWYGVSSPTSDLGYDGPATGYNNGGTRRNQGQSPRYGFNGSSSQYS